MNAPAAGKPRRPRILRAAGALLLLVAIGLVAPHLTSGTELVRIRHALLLGPDLPRMPDWQPPAVPADFKRDPGPADPFFAEVATRLRLAEQPDDWTRVLVISRHLLGSAVELNGGAIQKDLRATYREIVERGNGYCGDFVRAFTAIASAAGMTVRPWAFSFDGFGGHGHIWLETWNRDLKTWQLVDIFNNGYFVRGDAGTALSAAEVRDALARGDAGLRIALLHDGARPGFAIEAKAWDYFRRGLPQWFAPWGINVYAVDASWPVRVLGGVSRSAESLGTIALGLQPQVRMLATTGNAADRAAMRGLRARLGWAGALGALGVLLLVGASFVSRPRAATAGEASSPARRDDWPRLAIVGPLPPPGGGMANQCEQLVRLLQQEGAEVEVVRTNAPYRPAVVGRVPVLRALFRLLPYLGGLWSACGRAQVVHLFANSGWAWHLLAAPALGVARLRGVPVIVNYRGGQAAEFFAGAPGHVLAGLRGAALRVTPSTFLREVFSRHGLEAEIIPNIVDLSRFAPRPARSFGNAPHVIVTRHLERIYDIPTALRAFARIRARYGEARLTVAGTGPERAALETLAGELGLAGAVRFTGALDNTAIAALYAEADLMLNSSTADNMPISILEALASGVPVVSTDAGGIPHLVQHGIQALLVPVGDDRALGDAALRVLGEPALALRLRQQGLAEASRYAWPTVRAQWHGAYRRASGMGPLPALAGQTS